MSRTHAIAFAVVLLLAAPSVVAVADAPGRAFYLPRAGEVMTDAAPTNEDPSGLSTLAAEAVDGAPYAARTAFLDEELRIGRAGAFALHVDQRAPVAPGEQTFTTAIRVSLFREDGSAAQNEDGSLFYVAREERTFVHPGGATGDAAGWIDFAFDATNALPAANHCNADLECYRVEGGAVVVPAGFALALEFGLVGDGCGPTGSVCVNGETFGSAADAWVSLGDELAAAGIVDMDHPAPAPFEALNATDIVERLLRQQDGRDLASLLAGSSPPSSTWRTASTTSDSRLVMNVL